MPFFREYLMQSSDNALAKWMLVKVIQVSPGE